MERDFLSSMFNILSDILAWRFNMVSWTIMHQFNSNSSQSIHKPTRKWRLLWSNLQEHDIGDLQRNPSLPETQQQSDWCSEKGYSRLRSICPILSDLQCLGCQHQQPDSQGSRWSLCRWRNLAYTVQRRICHQNPRKELYYGWTYHKCCWCRIFLSPSSHPSSQLSFKVRRSKNWSISSLLLIHYSQWSRTLPIPRNIVKSSTIHLISQVIIFTWMRAFYTMLGNADLVFWVFVDAIDSEKESPSNTSIT